MNDRQVARVGDLVSCPIHGVNQIIAACADIVVTTEQKTAHVVAISECGAQIITGSEDVVINGQK